MPQNIMGVLCTAVQLDHLKFVYYWPEMCSVGKKLSTFISSSLLFAVGCMHVSGKRNHV